MPSTLTKLATATIVLALSAVVPGCSCSYSSSVGSKGTQAPSSSGKPINQSGKPAGTSKSTNSEGTSKAIPKGDNEEPAADPAAAEPEPADAPVSSPSENTTIRDAPADPDPGPVSGKSAGSTLSDKTASNRVGRD